MQNSFFQLFKVPETRRRILTTLGLLLVYRLGFQIPIPGMSPDFLLRGKDQGSFFGLMSAFSGGAIGDTNLFALGIMPYISASIIFSMLTKVSPGIEAIQKEGAAGQKKINQWTRLAVVPIAIIQGLFVYTGVFLKDSAMIEQGMRDNHFALGLIVVASLLAGAMFVMWIGELITELGVGNGASLIIMAGIIAHIPPAMIKLYTGDSEDFWQTLLLLSAIWVVTVLVVVFIHKGTRRIPIQYARLVRGPQGQMATNRHFLPLKVNMAGVMPIVFASVIFIVPALIFKWLNLADWEQIFSTPTGFVHISIYVSLVFFFCFFWNRLMFQPAEIADNLREHGSFVPGIRPGQKTAEFLSSVLTRITLAGAAFLAIIAIAPAFVTQGTSLPQDMRYFLGGTSVLIVVGVALDLVDRLNAQLVMRNYDGFMKSSGPGWTRGGRGDSK
ncbi:MAG: preprotein translocase subunit SecY [Planctomycetota bacterium]|nr:preprotein translocase subunit SecY [Planctomycetota bacterium]